MSTDMFPDSFHDYMTERPYEDRVPLQTPAAQTSADEPLPNLPAPQLSPASGYYPGYFADDFQRRAHELQRRMKPADDGEAAIRRERAEAFNEETRRLRRQATPPPSSAEYRMALWRDLKALGLEPRSGFGTRIRTSTLVAIKQLVTEDYG